MSPVPLRSVLRGYRRDDFRHDAAAAAVLVTLLVPAGLGYAELAGLPAVTGLYATVAALTAYALLGPSPVLVLGPDSSLAPIIAATVVVAAGGDTHRAVALAGLLAILSGVVLVAGGALRLGFVMDLFSNPIRLGYMNGVALTVIASSSPRVSRPVIQQAHQPDHHQPEGADLEGDLAPQRVECLGGAVERKGGGVSFRRRGGFPQVLGRRKEPLHAGARHPDQRDEGQNPHGNAEAVPPDGEADQGGRAGQARHSSAA